jgi:cytochrome c-type biogenesis protein CcmH
MAKLGSGTQYGNQEASFMMMNFLKHIYGFYSRLKSINARLRILPLLGATLMLVVLFQVVAAETPQPPVSTPSDDAVNAVAKQLYCPVCENIPLDVCPTQACAQWRDLIRQKLADGWTEQQIKDYFVAQYGDKVLAEPPRRGLNWLVYTLPPLFFIIGAFLLFRVFRRMQKTVPEQPSTPLPTDKDDPYVARMEEELRRRQDE